MNARLCNRIVVLILGAFLTITAASCTKAYDYLKDHSAASCCRIDSVVATSLYPGSDPVQHFYFHYNAAGLPTLIAAQDPRAYQYQNWIFRYDSHNRLKDYIFADGGTGIAYALGWDRYTYPAPHTIVDSTYDYQGQITDTDPMYPERFTGLRILTQDAQGRTTRIIYSSPYNPTRDTFYYRYDAQGDAIFSGVTYDNKVNVYSLSPTWQQIFVNYSVHNPFMPATDVFPPSISAYNQFGLPVTFQQRSDHPQLMFFLYTKLQVSYSCDKTKTTIAY